ncbi:MAG: FlgD immunoglobulin-like domain containing protein [Candidatus Eisenbacteria bacterium]
MIGADIWDGTPSALNTFKNQTGITFPLLLNAGLDAGGNLVTAYFDRDNYVIIDQTGIERYSARQQGYGYGAALDVPRMRALVDSLITHATGVGDPGAPAPEATLLATPNPFRDRTRIDAAIPSAGASAIEISVLDLAGRRVATLATRGPDAGHAQTTWDGHDDTGRALPTGVYLIRAQAGGLHFTRRIVLLR